MKEVNMIQDTACRIHRTDRFIHAICILIQFVCIYIKRKTFWEVSYIQYRTSYHLLNYFVSFLNIK